jgi:hypothetical protein
VPATAPPTDWAKTWPTLPAPVAEVGGVREWRLARRREHPGIAILVLLPFCVILDTVAIAGFVRAFGQLAAGGGLGLPIFLLPFALLGLVLTAVLAILLADAAANALAGDVWVECDTPFVRAGGRLNLLVGQSGGRPLAGWRVALTCTEKAAYTFSTKKMTHTHVTHKIGVLGPDAKAAPGDLADGVAASVVIPADAMHSFEAKNNRVEWVVEVRGRVLGFLPFHGDYPLVVLPPPGPEEKDP